MKKYAVLGLFTMLALLLVPLIMFDGTYSAAENGEELRSAAHEAQITEGDESTAGITEAGAENEVISVFMSDTGIVESMPLKDYIIGVVAAEMPAAYETEALKAQAAASITLSRRMLKKNINNGSLSGAVISTDSKKYQGYMTEDTMRERWGEDFSMYYEKIKAAVEEVYPYEITYEGEPILAAFHAISSGVTEKAENVWSTGESYLINVESEGDKTAEKYASSLTVSADEFASKLGETDDFTPSGDPSEWVGDTVYSEAGTLLSVNICGTAFSGAKLRDIFVLRSSAVAISFADGNFTFNVSGYGHGVGLSQYGADYYAGNGYGWRDIIAHYYPGTQITEVKNGC